MIRTLMRLVPTSAKPLLGKYVGLLVAAVITRAGACVTLIPVLDRLLGPDPSAARSWVLVFVIIAAANAAVTHRLGRTGFALGLEVMTDLQYRLIDHLGEVPLGWPTGNRRASTQRVLSSSGQEVTQTIGNLVTPLAVAVGLPIAISLGLIGVAWQLGVAALVAVPLLLGAWWGANLASARADAEFSESVTQLDDRVLEFARAQRTLRGARRADPDTSAAGRALEDQHVATISLLRWSLPGQLLFSIASQLALLVLAITALWLLRTGEVSVPEAIGLVVVAVRFLEPFTTLGELSPAIGSAKVTLGGIAAVLDAPTLEARSPTHRSTSSSNAPEVRMNGVRFTYPGASTAAIDGVDLVAPAGATTAIVGPSGAGKSTLLGLIARFHDPDEGSVFIGDDDVRDLPPGDLYAELSMVFQNPYLFEGTIAANVTAGRPEADSQQLDEAATSARVDEIVERLPSGWETPVGEGGVALSGGERQRVGIARALVKQATLLLVDEATSSLDPANERAVADALASGRGQRTTLVVAHRMRTIEAAEHIVFVDDGRVIESGTREELLASGGRFADFHRDRSASETWTLSH